jgi:hypothetical protein
MKNLTNIASQATKEEFNIFCDAAGGDISHAGLSRSEKESLRRQIVEHAREVRTELELIARDLGLENTGTILVNDADDTGRAFRSRIAVSGERPLGSDDTEELQATFTSRAQEFIQKQAAQFLHANRAMQPERRW